MELRGRRVSRTTSSERASERAQETKEAVEEEQRIQTRENRFFFFNYCGELMIYFSFFSSLAVSF
jgi:hypothetical protein